MKFLPFENRDVSLDYPSDWERIEMDKMIKREMKYASSTIDQMEKEIASLIESGDVTMVMVDGNGGIMEVDNTFKGDLLNIDRDEMTRYLIGSAVANTVAEFGPSKNDNVYVSLRKVPIDGMLSMEMLENMLPVSANTTINGVEMLETSIVIEVDKDKAVKEVGYTTIIDNFKYTITFGAPEKNFDTYRNKYFEKIAQSIIFNKARINPYNPGNGYLN